MSESRNLNDIRYTIYDVRNMMDKHKLFKYCFGCEPGKIAPTVVMTPFLAPEKFQEHGAVEHTFKGRLYSGATIAKSGRKFTVIKCGIGSLPAGDATLLLDLTAAESLIFAGSCGGFGGCKTGDLIVCESVFNGEGFSRYHKHGFKIDDIFKSEDFISADPDHTESYRDFMLGKVSDSSIIKVGDIFTTGSLMAEKPEALSAMAAKGFKGIDMELSAVYHAAEVIDMKAAGILIVSDLPLDKPVWEEMARGEKSRYNSTMRELVRYTSEFALK